MPPGAAAAAAAAAAAVAAVPCAAGAEDAEEQEGGQEAPCADADADEKEDHERGYVRGDDCVAGLHGCELSCICPPIAIVSPTPT